MNKLMRPIGLAALLAGGFWLYTTLRSGSPFHAHDTVKIVEAAPQSRYEPDELRDIDIYRRVRPSVVNITSQIIQYDLLFGPVPASGQGSGFIINSKGYILTNYHVIANARRLRVTWTPEKNKSRSFAATVVGAAPELDLAVIKIDAQNLPAVTLGDSSNLQVGQKVLAIGNPFGLPGTMTQGIISSIRTVREPGGGVHIDGAIQTDAAINPGNSGGPLLNSRGEVIGIDSAIYSQTGSNVGIGFAIPVNMAKAVLPQLITTGHVVRPSLGIRSFPLSPDISAQLGLPVDKGLMLIDVEPGSPAAHAGLHGGNIPGYIGNMKVNFGGDIIVGIDGHPVEDASDLDHELILKHAGDHVTLDVIRGQKRFQATVTLGSSSHGATV